MGCWASSAQAAAPSKPDDQPARLVGKVVDLPAPKPRPKPSSKPAAPLGSPVPLDICPPCFAPCVRIGCPCQSSWNGKQGEYCCLTCKGGTPCAGNYHRKPAQVIFPCARDGCACTASFNGKMGDYCCKSCRHGTPCVKNVHSKPLKLLPKATGPLNLCKGGCGARTKKADEFCIACKASSLNDFKFIRARADSWARSVWPAKCDFRIIRFYQNPGLDNSNCPAKWKFEGGLKQLQLEGSDISNAEFAWHGTKSLAAVQAICWDGLNPRLRQGQAHGIGEYCSIDATDSQSYASSTGYLIVFLLLNGGHKKPYGSYRIVDNPVNGNPMYCLPVGVVDYNANVDPQLRKTASG